MKLILIFIIYIFCFVSISLAVSVGVLSALKTFFRTIYGEMTNDKNKSNSEN